jgi:O-antigen ligase
MANDALPESASKSADDDGNSGNEVRLLTALIIALFAIPSALVFGPLGSAGTPALVMGLLFLLLWFFSRLAGRSRPTNQPLMWVAFLFLGALAASYVAAMTRPIEAVEIRAADRGLISAIGWVGMLLFAMDGPSSSKQLDVVLRRLVLAGGLEALVGIAQFATGQPLTNLIVIPGLSANSDLSGVLGRGGFTRPGGTTIHPIEFGAVLTMILPLALHYAMLDKHRSIKARWFPVVAIAVAIPISISRSAILSSVVVLAFVLPTWAPALRRRAYASIAFMVVGLGMAVHGLLSTLTGLFTGIGEDSSASSRTDSYQLAADFIGRAPFFGRGFRTFLPKYRILDNQLLGLAIETGIVGLTIFVGFVFFAVTQSLRVRRASTDPNTRSLAQAFAASITAACLSFAVYDAFSFPMAASMLFLMIGLAGAHRRLVNAEQ